MTKTIRINAKCSDMFSAILYEDGKQIGEYNGYVPGWMPGHQEGDYVELEIDLTTGQIRNWNCPTFGQLNKTFGKQIPSRRGSGEPDYASVGTSGLWPVKK